MSTELMAALTYVSSRPGDLITLTDAAAALSVPAPAADIVLGHLSVSLAGGTLTRRRGGWVYWPDSPDPDA